jgi:hypothetical protein
MSQLGTSRLKIPVRPGHNEFRFCVGTVSYDCTTFLAEMISPAIARLRLSDPTVIQFVIETPDPLSLFSGVLAMGRGEPVTIDQSHHSFFLSVFRELGASAMYFSILEYFEGPPTFSNLIDRLRLIDEFEGAADDEFSFAAHNFADISPDLFGSLTLAHLYTILSRPSLRLKDEESLCDLIFEHLEFEPRWATLFDFVKFDQLLPPALDAFSYRLPEIHEFLNPWILRAVGDRLALRVSPPTPNLRAITKGVTREFRFDSKSPLSGIIAQLTLDCGGNVHDHGVVSITASSVEGGNSKYAARHLADLNTKEAYRSDNNGRSWVCYEFKDMVVVLNYYTFLTFHNIPGEWSGIQPRSWVVEGSKTMENWQDLDHRSAATETRGADQMASFPIAKQIECRFIRVRSTGNDHGGVGFLELAAIEFFGTVTTD